MANSSLVRYQFITFVLTFFAYASMHSLRTSWSYSKHFVLSDPGIDCTAPMLGRIDFTFLVMYALSMLSLGWIGDRVNLKYYLATGLLGAGLAIGTIAILKLNQIESFFFFILFMAVNGVFQSLAWPACIAIMGNWIPKKQGGIILGLWAGTRNIGNIVGFEIGHITLDEYNLDWPWALLYASLFAIIMVFMILFFLNPYPEKVGVSVVETPSSSVSEIIDSMASYQTNQNKPVEGDDEENQKPLSFARAWCIPGVPFYALSYASIKGTCYGLLFWLAPYLKSHGLGSHSAGISQINDLGQLFGGFLLGVISDKIQKRALLLPLFLLIAASLFGVLRSDSQHEIWFYYFIIFFCGFSLGGPYNLIGSAIAAQLGKHQSLRGNKKALSTVTAIIEGTGSLGASLLQLVIPYIKDIFILFLGTCTIGVVISLPLAYLDLKSILRRRNRHKAVKADVNNVKERLIEINPNN